jgi:hypothetical protein
VRRCGAREPWGFSGTRGPSGLCSRRSGFLSNQNPADNQLNVLPERALAVRSPESEIATWRDPDWQRLWLAVESRPWRSLALVPAGQGASPNFTLVIAVALSRTGMVHLGSPIQVADATRVQLNQLTPFLEELRRCTSTGERLIVALPSTEASPVTGSIAHSVDAALLCVMLDRMTSAQAQNTVKLVGASRFLGSAIFRRQQLQDEP